MFNVQLREYPQRQLGDSSGPAYSCDPPRVRRAANELEQ